jgi:hypothetical protein
VQVRGPAWLMVMMWKAKEGRRRATRRLVGPSLDRPGGGRVIGGAVIGHVRRRLRSRRATRIRKSGRALGPLGEGELQLFVAGGGGGVRRVQRMGCGRRNREAWASSIGSMELPVAGGSVAVGGITGRAWGMIRAVAIAIVTIVLFRYLASPWPWRAQSAISLADQQEEP